jgi:CRP/FNR family transcriptional regulator
MSAIALLDTKPEPMRQPVPLELIDLTERPSVQSILRCSTLLNALTEEELAKLASVSRVARAHRGDYIWLNGAETDFFGIAGTGFVKMVRSCAEGMDVTLELMGPGQVFGMSGAITGRGCPLSAVAVTDLWYLRVPKSSFLEIYRKNAAMKDRLARRLIIRLQNANDLMARMSTGKVDERIAAILFVLAESYGVRENGRLTLRVPLTRQEISEMAGTTVESTIRTMSRWQKEGVISTERHYVSVLDEDRLSEALVH